MYDEHEEIRKRVYEMRNNKINWDKEATDYWCWIEWVEDMINEEMGFPVEPESITINPELWRKKLDEDIDEEIDIETYISTFEELVEDMWHDDVTIKFDCDIPVEFSFAMLKVCLDCPKQPELMYDTNNGTYYCPSCNGDKENRVRA